MLLYLTIFLALTTTGLVIALLCKNYDSKYEHQAWVSRLKNTREYYERRLEAASDETFLAELSATAAGKAADRYRNALQESDKLRKQLVEKNNYLKKRVEELEAMVPANRSER